VAGTEDEPERICNRMIGSRQNPSPLSAVRILPSPWIPVPTVDSFPFLINPTSVTGILQKLMWLKITLG
jgi:hypothetical protein